MYLCQDSICNRIQARPPATMVAKRWPLLSAAANKVRTSCVTTREERQQGKRRIEDDIDQE